MTDPRTELPPERGEDLIAMIREEIAATTDCVVAFDDDPTGTQTVYDTPVLTEWSVESLVAALEEGESLFYVLTNSRALTEPEAVELSREIGRNLTEASRQAGRNVTVISRSDSTLRGHYPAEVVSLADELGQSDATHVIMPFFLQGGRLTIDDVHYVAEGERLVPAAETPFANDATFGFTKSNLREWAIEKHAGDLSEDRLHSIGLGELRTGDIDALVEKLVRLPKSSILIVNAEAISDAQAFALAARRAERRGAKFLYRTAASFVQAYAGLEAQPLLSSEQLVNPQAEAGMIVVGSYVPKTTDQLNHLLSQADAPKSIELKVSELLGEGRERHLAAVRDEVNQTLASGTDLVLHTSRDLVLGDDANSSLAIGNQVSAAVVELVRSTKWPIRFLIAKGGITSSDVATKSLGARRATVKGQILPGIPVWELGPESLQAGLSYVVFPGNVGGTDALTQAYRKLRR